VALRASLKAENFGAVLRELNRDRRVDDPPLDAAGWWSCSIRLLQALKAGTDRSAP